MMKQKTRRLFLIILSVIFILTVACSKTDENPKYNPPADHTISKSGYMHKSGLDQPLVNCIACHGADLKGGTSGVSCFACHGQKW